MKKTITRILALFTLAVFMLAIDTVAQTTLTKTVAAEGADYTNIWAAISGSQGSLVAGDSLIINVLAGTVIEPTTLTANNKNWQKKLYIVVNGAGADATIVQSPLGQLPNIDGSDGGRLWQINQAAMDGSTLTFKNLTFKYFGTASGNFAGGTLFRFNVVKMDILFENVVFDSCLGRALFQAFNHDVGYVFDNCLFINCVATYNGLTPSQRIEGLVNKTGGTLKMKNTTFMSNTILNPGSQTFNTITNNGGLINVVNGAPTILLENNAFINNLYDAEASDSIQPIISFKPEPSAGTANITLKSNISIGNRRAGKINDIDLLYNHSESVVFDLLNTGNIFNKLVKRTSTTIDEVTTITYEDVVLPGTKVNPDYTYTHPDINFEMDGNLPKLLLDVHKIGYVSYSGDGGTVSVNMQKSNPLKVYAFDRLLKVEGLKAGEKLEVFTIAGSVFSRRIVNGDAVEMEMPKGIYIVRAGSETRKVLIH